MKQKPLVIYILWAQYLTVLAWWVLAYIAQLDEYSNYLFAFYYGMIPLVGGIGGMLAARKWGWFTSKMGKAAVFLSLGLITWSLGESIWGYYNIILNVAVPYPSWADASFIISWPLWTLGVYYLSFATGAKFGLKNKRGVILALLIPVAAVVLSYYLLITVARGGSFEIAGGLLKIFFDLAYPIWDVIILTVSLLVYGLSFKFLGGIYKKSVIIILAGFVINYFADFAFSYTTTVETYYTGNWVDLLFATAMFTLAIGVNGLNVTKSS